MTSAVRSNSRRRFYNNVLGRKLLRQNINIETYAKKRTKNLPSFHFSNSTAMRNVAGKWPGFGYSYGGTTEAKKRKSPVASTGL
jgi:hypothetical protein